MGKYTYSDGTTPNICIVGAGFSGLTAAIKLKKELKITSFQMFDENEDVGGTWLVNKYPGVACDVESHLYSWSFEPNPNWSQRFSGGAEIQEYIRNTTKKYDLYPHIKFHTKVSKMEWDQDINQWRVTTFNTKTNKEQELLFDIVVNGPGALRLPSIPRMFEDFTGTKVHTAQWQDGIDFENKVVGVVGSGASAVQVIQEIAPKVKELHCYQRRPAWIKPRSQGNFSETTKWIFNVFPPIMWLYRFWIYFLNEIFHSIFTYEHWTNRIGSWNMVRRLRTYFPKGDPKADQLTPNYTLGCKRIILSSDYYPALAMPHVKVIRDEITKITGNEIGTKDGKKQKLDLLILATGFQVQNFYEPMKVIGKDGIDLLATWKKEGPSTYYGIATAIAPNQFILLGPNTALGHNSVLIMIECQANFMIQVVQEMMRRNSRRVTLKADAEVEFTQQTEESMKSTVWVKGNCDAWYMNSKGTVTALWPHTCTRYWLETRNVNHSVFEYL